MYILRLQECRISSILLSASGTAYNFDEEDWEFALIFLHVAGINISPKAKVCEEPFHSKTSIRLACFFLISSQLRNQTQISWLIRDFVKQ